MAYETIYQRWSDNVARNADEIAIVDGVPPDDLTNYGPTSLIDGNPAKFAKIASTDGAWEFAFLSPQRVDLVALIHHSFSPDSTVLIQATSGGSPFTADFEAEITIPEWLGTSTWIWPVNPWLDLTQQPGYSASGFTHWRITVTDNDQNLELGKVWFGSEIRRLSPDIRWNYSPSTRKRIIDNRTSFDVSTIYSRGTTHWRLDADVPADNDLEALLEAHWYNVDGRAQPWLIIPQPPKTNDTDVMDLRGNRAYMVRFAEDMRIVPHAMFDHHPQRISVEEVSRGLRPGGAI